MRNILWLATLYLIISPSYSQTTKSEVNKPKLSYKIMYGIDEKYVYDYKATIYFALGYMHMYEENKADDIRQWKCQYKGIVRKQDGDIYFEYFKFYLPLQNEYLHISKNKIIKHRDKFYYSITIGNQLQLAL